MLKIILTILAALYAASPLDILPEAVIGWLGWIDDIVIFFLLWRFVYAAGRQPRRTRPGNRTGGASEQKGPGPSEANMAPDPWQVLGVPRDASPEDIKKAYKKLAGQYHPDKVHHLADEFKVLAEKRFKEIQAAYEAIRRR